MKSFKELYMNHYRNVFLIIALIFFISATYSCGLNSSVVSPVGLWRGVLQSPGGELPFGLEIKMNEQGSLIAGVRNGEEYLPFTFTKQEKLNLEFVFEHYDSVITAALSPTSNTMKGTWSRRSLGGKRTTMDFYADKNAGYRFMPIENKKSNDVSSDISGNWIVEFSDADGTSEAKAIFKQEGNRLEGTFLTPVGDYRFLEGTYEAGKLFLSVFDGAHAFLFKAEMNREGRFSGDFWSRDSYHATWTAVRGEKEMPDPYTLTKLSNQENRFRFSFPGLDGKVMTDKDERFKGKALIVYIFGTWCPNCNDEAPFLEELYKTYHPQGLEVIGLANEFSGEFSKDRDMVKRYKKKYGLSWPVLIVGIADKKKTAEALSDLDHVLAYPTTLFIDRKGKVQKIYTGFSGPGTGKYYQILRKEFKQNIDNLLKQI
jgi:thiol-disulfide isomerase/thioredoxin